MTSEVQAVVRPADLRVPAAQLLRLWRAQRARPQAPAPPRGAPLVDRVRPRGPVRGLAGRHPRRDHRHDPRRGDGLGPGRRGQLGRDGPDEPRLQAAGPGRHARSAPRAGSCAPAPADRYGRPGGRRRTAPSWRPPRRSTSPPARSASAQLIERVRRPDPERPGNAARASAE